MAPRRHRFSNRKKTSTLSVKPVLTRRAWLITSEPSDASLAKGHEATVVDMFSTGQRLGVKARHSIRKVLAALARAFNDALLPGSLEDDGYFNIKRMRSVDRK